MSDGTQELAKEILRNAAPPVGLPRGVVPLARLYGVVTAVATGPPVTVSLTLSGSSTIIVGVPTLAAYTPTTGDLVIIDKSGDTLLVLGTVG